MGCLESTRSAILDRIHRWIDINESWPPVEMVLEEHQGDSGVQRTATDDRPIFWINGLPGTGKTAIAYTIAKTCETYGILGASFFCSRDDAECSNPNLVFTTIAYQLGLFCSGFKDEVTRALKLNPDIGYSSPSYQLEELIVKPLRTIGESFPPCVIVLDALDECKDSDATSVILSSLCRHVAALSRLKILVTSRPEQHITAAFKSRDLDPATQRLILHEIQLVDVHNDIERYITSYLARVQEGYGLEISWPSVADVRALAQLSSGLFIFAATAVKFIEDRNFSDPRGQLTSLLDNTPTIARSTSSPLYQLDLLYTQVVVHPFPDISTNFANRLKMVLGTILILQDPLPPIALEKLLRLVPNTIHSTLAHLHSVVIVPEDDTQGVRIIHPSFFDFMTDPGRCMDAKFAVNTRAQHTLLAHTCLETMQALRRDMCNIKNPTILNDEVKDLSVRISVHIPPHLQYACRHWAFHLANAMASDVLLDLLKEFSSKYLLNWVEVCSLLGELRSALLVLDAAQQALAVRHLVLRQ